MADNVPITAGSGTTIATDDAGSAHYQKVKLVDGTADATTVIAAGGGVEAGALRVTIASDSTGLVSVDDNGGSLTVDNGGTFAVQATLAAETTKVIGTVNVAASQTIAVTQATAGSLNCTEASAAAIKTSVELLDDAVVADDAGFTAGTTKVHMAGFVLDNTSTDALDENDAGAARITTDRRQIVQLGESGAKYVKGGGSKTDTSAQSLMAASGDATTSNYLCWVTVYNSSATNTAVEIRDGTTTVVAIIPAPAYGGATFVPTYPIKMTANTATNAYSQASVTTLYVYGGGYTCV